MTMSKSSALSISVLLIFEMRLINGALFLSANFLSNASLFGFVTIIFPLTTIYASLIFSNHFLAPFFSNKSRYFIRCVV